MRRLLCFSIGFLLLASCGGFPVSPDPVSEEESQSSIAEPVTEMTYEGTVQTLGVSIYMQGTHRLFTDETATPLLLESSLVRLDDYVDRAVRVMGPVRATVEGNAMIMDVQAVEGSPISEGIDVLEEGSSSNAAESSFSSESSESSSIAPPPPASSSAPPAVPPKPASSSSAAASSVSSGQDRSAAANAMGKAAVDAASFNQQYCTGHIGFCVPYHKNWYFKSFGGNVSPWLWHVEFGNAAIETEGDGILIVNLTSGSLAAGEPEGSAIAQGDFVVAKRQWTGNRHFVVSGPAELKNAVEYMAQNIIVYQAE